MIRNTTPARRKPRHAYLLAVPFVVSLLVLAGCQAPATTAARTGTDAVLWTQQAAEHDALFKAVYASATARLDEAVAESQQRGSGKPPAVVLDVDETMLDNTPYQAWLIKRGQSYDRETWDAWCQKSEAEPLPGAASFLAAARASGVEVFYVTNRDVSVKDATYRNLKRVADPAVTSDRVLFRGERGWTGEKGSRWAFIEQTHDIVMMLGDNLGDFYSEVNVSPAERDAMVENARGMWGHTWFVLPNPMYGSWERTAVEGDGDARAANKIETLRAYD